jgi:branched-chain amino acid transport system ATP-binding protein
MSAVLLALDGFAVSYGEVRAVQDVRLSLCEGEIVTVIGPNGAGKSTMLNAIMGLLPSSGEIAVAGASLRPRVERMVAQGVALVPEQRELFGEMTIEDNLVLGGFSRRAEGRQTQRDALARVFALFPRLQERRRQQASTLSGGERQMLAIGRALMARPRLLMLDEPSLGLAPRVVADVLRTISQLRDSGISILLVEQNARAALQVADRAYVLEGGRVTLSGPAAALLHDQRVIDTYLGLGGGKPETPPTVETLNCAKERLNA